MKRTFYRFLAVWSGQLFSRIGSGLSAFALGVYVYGQTGLATSYSLLLLCAFLPSIVLAPVGGVLADRFDRKLMMVIGDVGAAAGIAAVLGMLLLKAELLWPLYIGVALSSVCVALHSPAFKSTVTDLLDEEEYAKAGGLIQLAEASRYIISPILAGFLLGRMGIEAVLAIDIGTFFFAALMVMLIRGGAASQHAAAVRQGPVPRRVQAVRHMQEDEALHVAKDILEGLHYVFRDRYIRTLLIMTTVVTFFTGVMQSLFVPMILSIADAATLGTVQSTAASGMLLSSLFIGSFGKSVHQERILGVSLVLAGAGYCLIGLSPNTAAVTVSAFGFFLMLPFINTSLEVLFRRNISSELQGRSWATISLVSQSGMLTAFAVSGVLADSVFNTIGNMVVWFGAGFLLFTLYHLRFQIRRGAALA